MWKPRVWRGKRDEKSPPVDKNVADMHESSWTIFFFLFLLNSVKTTVDSPLNRDFEEKLDSARNKTWDENELDETEDCRPISTQDLNRMLGGAFNARYMAVEKPDEALETWPQLERLSTKLSENQSVDPVERKASDFAVSSRFARILDEMVERKRRHAMSGNELQQIKSNVSKNLESVSDKEVSKNVDFDGWSRKKESQVIKERRKDRSVKSASGGGVPWTCRSKLHWLDLGQDYYPRYLRSVLCTTDKCWFGHFRCRGRAFTVKVLRRRSRKNGKNCSHQKGKNRLIHDVVDEWVFEERAVNFCCECTV